MTSQIPTFKCPTDQDTTYGGVYFEKIGLITADEIYFAGANKDWTLFNSYLDHQNEFWTMTPWYNGTPVSVMVSPGNNQNILVDTVSGVRPVISLNKDVTVTGSGTNIDPYVINTN